MPNREDKFEEFRERMIAQRRAVNPELEFMTREEKLKGVCDFVRIFEGVAAMEGYGIEIVEIEKGSENKGPSIAFKLVADTKQQIEN